MFDQTLRGFSLFSVIGHIWCHMGLVLCTILTLALPAAAQEQKVGAVTKLPIPRFVSLKSDEVNVRLGPGGDYAIAWVFKRPGLPVEILAEFESWRQIRDSEGGTGWVAAVLLSGRRTALVAPWVKEASMFQLTSSKGGGSVVANIESGAKLDLVSCDGQYCEAYAGDSSGWIAQKHLWGVYPLEVIK
jgi:SH3-like domain-containing protein